MMKNPMSPERRRLLLFSTIGAIVTAWASSHAWWAFLPFFGVYALVIGFWPSNKALKAAEERKALEEGSG